MIGRLAFRSLTAHPVRSAVLAAGFGVGVAVMAILLGVAAIVLEQAQSPALVGGGDVNIRLSLAVPARIVLSGTLQSDALRPRVRAAAASHTTDLFLLHNGKATRVAARGGIPSVEKELGDPEVAGMEAWRDTREDSAWTRQSPETVLRQIDRFHGVPDVPEWSDSWAEWLYFNGRSSDARFYLTFMTGPRTKSGNRVAGVRLQLERDGKMQSYSANTEATDAELANTPDLTIGNNSVRLDGLRLSDSSRSDRHIGPARGWRPHASGLSRATRPADRNHRRPRLADGLRRPGDVGRSGWIADRCPTTRCRWLAGPAITITTGDSGRVCRGSGDRRSRVICPVIYGRVFPPPEAADPERIPGFVGALGPDGPLGYSTDVRITETNDDKGQPRSIAVRARSSSLTLDLRFDVASMVTSRMQGALANGVNFLQMRGQYTVSGEAGTRKITFTAPGAAETFRGN